MTLTGDDYANLRKQLIAHEGLRLFPYHDTRGKLTIGVGRNLDDTGISEPEAVYLMMNDLARVDAQLSYRFPWYSSLAGPRRYAVVDMAFNLGAVGFGRFKRMIQGIQTGDWDYAAQSALDSKWASQVGQRAETVAKMMRDEAWVF